MNIIIIIFITFITIITPITALAVNTKEASTPGLRKEVKLSAVESIRKNKSNQEIERRVVSLNKLSSRIQEMKKLTSTDQAALSSQLQSEIAALNALKVSIAGETDPVALKAARDSITKEYRIYMLFMPKIHILAAADRLVTAADQLSALAVKLQTRLAEIQGLGIDVANLQATLADLQTRITNIKTQAQNAKDIVNPLLPDEGDKAKVAANLQALKKAREMIQAGHKDLQAGKKDIQIIRQGLTASKSAVKKMITPTATTSATAR